MRIKTKTSQTRRDFTALYRCGHCGAEETGQGYDDRYFHEQVIPAMKCGGCGEAEPYGPTSTPDVPAGVVL